MRRSLPIGLAALALLAASAASAAECAPERMVRATFKNITPGAAPAPAKTFHRLAERYARVEEALTPGVGRQILMVVNEPDVWVVSRTENKGQHIVDPGPVFEFHAPIFSGPGVPAVFARLETGCELDFLATYAPRPVGQVTVEGATLDRHEVSLGADRVEILVRPGGRQVFQVAHHRGDKPMLVLRYMDYATGLEPDMALFAKPEGVTYIEPKPAAKP